MPAIQPAGLGRRIVIWGATGSGKTTLARRLAGSLDAPRIELDAVFWQPNWVETPVDEFRAKVQAALDAAGDAWVLDGSYSRVSDIYLSRADTLIWLHLPWRVSFWRLLQRTIGRARTGETLYYEGGPRESWRKSFFHPDSVLWWSISHHRTSVRRTRQRIAALPPHVRAYELRSSREVDAFLQAQLPSESRLSKTKGRENGYK